MPSPSSHVEGDNCLRLTVKTHQYARVNITLVKIEVRRGFTASSVTLRLMLTEHTYNSYTIKSNFSIVFDQRHLFGLIEQLASHNLAERDGKN